MAQTVVICPDIINVPPSYENAREQVQFYVQYQLSGTCNYFVADIFGVGPDDLPKAARALGRGVKKVQNFLYDVKSYVNNSSEQETVENVKNIVTNRQNEIEL